MKIVVLALCLSGCGALFRMDAQNRRVDELQKKLDPVIGKGTDEGFAEKWGPPDKRDTIGRDEYWTYFFSYGSVRSGSAYTNPYTHQTTFNGGSVDTYDKIILVFRDGILRSWRATVQR